MWLIIPGNKLGIVVGDLEPYVSYAADNTQTYLGADYVLDHCFPSTECLCTSVLFCFVFLFLFDLILLCEHCIVCLSCFLFFLAAVRAFIFGETVPQLIGCGLMW